MGRDWNAEFARGLESVGSDELRQDEWMRYPDYQIEEDAGQKYIYAPWSVEQFEGRRAYRPLSLSNAGLFQEFANWAKEWRISKSEPNSKRNEEAARAWAKKYGVLGVNPPDITMMGYSSSSIENYLGRPGPDGHVGQNLVNSGTGGKPYETVARFTDEALEAYVVLRLYDAATLENAPDVETIVGLMGKVGDDVLRYPSTAEIYGQTEESARNWALEFVEEVVTRKVAGRCYPTLFGTVGAYEQGWGFNSLLGAMWLQMLWMLAGQTRRCLLCHKILVPEEAGGSGARKRRTRSDKDFCSDEHRAAWNYHYGTGKSSKRARKQAREQRKKNTD